MSSVVNVNISSMTVQNVIDFAKHYEFKDIVKTISDEALNGFRIANIDDKMIETLFPQFGLRLQFKKMTELLGQCQANNNNIASDVGIELSNRKKWPIPFVFPDHRLDCRLKEHLLSPDCVLRERDVRSIVDALCKEMLEYLDIDDPYPTSVQYTLASNSILTKYPHLRTKDPDSFETYRRKIKHKMAEFRRNATCLSPTIKLKRAKYTAKNKKTRNIIGIEELLESL